ncbi:MAG: nicotinate-nucleotide adenylyltransferase [Chloroflexia bacterium]
MSPRIGILGGTFDPVHFGHLAIAEEARVRLPLDVVLLMPARIQPLRQQERLSSPEDRAAMLERAVLGNPGLQVSRIEFERPGPSYTVDTLTLLHERYPRGSEFFFILGSDAIAELPRWKDPERLMTLCRFVVFQRPGCDFDPRNLFLQFPRLRERTIFLEGPRLEISATELRRRVRQGLPIRYQTPDAVEEYIRSHRLYLED